jgi:hypothetical protein
VSESCSLVVQGRSIHSSSHSLNRCRIILNITGIVTTVHELPENWKVDLLNLSYHLIHFRSYQNLAKCFSKVYCGLNLKTLTSNVIDAFTSYFGDIGFRYQFEDQL